MFGRRTLFVLGAGTSAEVEMPVGAALAKTIRRKCDIRFERGFQPVGDGDFALFDQFGHDRTREINEYQSAAWLIRDGIQLSSSIDDFLDLHRDNAAVNFLGKAMIVKSILEAEQRSTLYFNRANGEQTIDFDKNAQTWFVKFMKILTRGQSLKDVAKVFDNVSFIVFNYDRCLEYFLVHALRGVYGIDERIAQEICNEIRVIHPYGSVGPLPAPGIRGVPFGASSSNCVALAPEIKTYTEQITDADDLTTIHTEVLSAQSIVFLGFAYHDQNMQMLTPSQALDYKPVYGTAYGMSEDDTAVVKGQIVQMFKSPGILFADSVKIKNDLTSAGLFDYFAKSLTSNFSHSTPKHENPRRKR
jgi:hypothetical protein